MKRQNKRKFLLILSLLLFPVTLYYFSPVLILNAGLRGIVNGSFVVFLLQFLGSIVFGRLFCGWLCPGGGLQECAFSVNDKRPKQGKRNGVKYIIWAVWILSVAGCYLAGRQGLALDFFFETDQGISVVSIQGYVVYYGIVLLILLPALFCGKRAFCHYLCWMAPFMVLGEKLGMCFHLPGMQVYVKEQERCVSCGLCSKACPMGIDVAGEIGKERVESLTCIQCGACVDMCRQEVLGLGIQKRKGNV